MEDSRRLRLHDVSPAAARREGPSAACLLLVELGAIELCVSREIMAEVRDVLARPRLRRKFPAMTDGVMRQLLTAIAKRSVDVAEVPRFFQFERNHKDEPYIKLAIAALWLVGTTIFWISPAFPVPTENVYADWLPNFAF